MRSWDHLGHPGPASVEGIETADFAFAVDLNLRSQMVTPEAALPELRARGGGSPLHTASTLGLAGPARPEEIANAALFLPSDEASFITGAALPLDRGTTA